MCSEISVLYWLQKYGIGTAPKVASRLIKKEMTQSKKSNANTTSCWVEQVFFTRNGKVVGRRELRLPVGGLYPTIGMMSTGEKVRVDLHPLSGWAEDEEPGSEQGRDQTVNPLLHTTPPRTLTRPNTSPRSGFTIVLEKGTPGNGKSAHCNKRRGLFVTVLCQTTK